MANTTQFYERDSSRGNHCLSTSDDTAVHNNDYNCSIWLMLIRKLMLLIFMRSRPPGETFKYFSFFLTDKKLFSQFL